MPIKYLTPAERKERADRNRALKAQGLMSGDPRFSKGKGAQLGEPIPGGPLDYAHHILEKIEKTPRYAGGEELTAEQLDTICYITSIGNFPHHAAETLGIPEGTWFNWMQKGRRGHEVYGPMYHAVRAARANAITVLVARMRTAADSGTWAAAARMLESFASGEWMRTERVVDETGSKFLELLTSLKEVREKALPREAKPVITVESTAVRHSLEEQKTNVV